MTNREQKKAKHEAAVLSQFLKNLNLTYADRGESDPHHDGWALKDGQRIAALVDDVQTHIYPRLHDEDSLRAVESMFASCKYDFTKCPLAQIWLMSQVSGHSMMMVPHRLFSSLTILQPNK